MVGGIVGSAQATIGAAQAIYGMFKAKKARKAQQDAINKQNEEIAKQEKANEAWYNKERYTSTLDREENRAAISAASEAIKEQNQQAESRAAITGASGESMAAQRANNMKLMGQLSYSNNSFMERKPFRG